MNIKAIKTKGTITAMIGLAMVTGLVGGSALKIADAYAQTTNTTVAPTSGQSDVQKQQPQSGQFDPSKGGHTANGKTEVLLTGDTAEKVKAAALAAIPGGTIQRVETDAEGGAYEAHMTKSDGSRVTVKFDSNFKIIGTETGQGPKTTH